MGVTSTGPVPVVLPALQLSGYGGYTYCTVSRELQRIRRDVLHWLTDEKYKVQSTKGYNNIMSSQIWRHANRTHIGQVTFSSVFRNGVP